MGAGWGEKGEEHGKGKGRGGKGKWYPHFLGESYAPESRLTREHTDWQRHIL